MIVTHITKADGNVFKDLGLPNADKLKAESDKRIKELKGK